MIHEEELLTRMDGIIREADIEELEVAIHVWRDNNFDKSVLQDAEIVYAQMEKTEEDAKVELEQALRKEITFASDSHLEFCPVGVASLQQDIKLLRRFPKVALEIHGHSSHRDPDVSRKIALDRATTVKATLEMAGLKNPMEVKSWAAHPKVQRKSVRIFPRWAPGRSYLKEHPEMSDFHKRLSRPSSKSSGRRGAVMVETPRLPANRGSNSLQARASSTEPSPGEMPQKSLGKAGSSAWIGPTRKIQSSRLLGVSTLAENKRASAVSTLAENKRHSHVSKTSKQMVESYGFT